MAKFVVKKGGLIYKIALLFFILAAAVLLIVFLMPPEEEKLIPPKIEVPPHIPPKIEVVELPKIAIVIDDMGRDMESIDEIIAANSPVTVAVLPHLKYSKEVARKAHANGLTVLLHVPMEPKDSITNDPGEGALLTAMSKDMVVKILMDDIEGIPYLSGVNNHMGSKFTEDKVLMREVLLVIKEKNLFFLDSKTTADSVVYSVAKSLGIKAASRNVFLDNSRNKDDIRKQFEEAISIAKKRGKAIAIGHPYPETLEVLKEISHSFKEKGVEAVAVSEVVE